MIQTKAILQAALDEGLINEHDIEQARKTALRDQRDVLTVLSFDRRIPLISFYRAYAQHHGLAFLNASELRPNVKLARKVGLGLIKARRVLPVSMAGHEETAFIACSALPDDSVRRQLERLLGGDIQFCMADQRALDAAIRQIEPALNPLVDVMAIQNEEAFDPIVELEDILDQAYLHRASDVHFEPTKEQMKVRLRVDGRLQEYHNRYNREQANGLISRIKVLSQLDIAETRMPQDGSMIHRVGNGVEFDIRVATMPTRFGERVTLRLLGTEAALYDLQELGMEEDSLKKFSETIQQPHGLILISGPTGSGKSTTLYAALQKINTPDINILTAEDPVEHPIEGISQLQVGVKVNFAGALRSFLRHDPDVIMVGEIRDGETADIAMKAAMTGHLVFSTLHTNTAAGCIARLRDLGAEPYLIASTLLAAIAQRLVRKLCGHCKLPYTIDDEYLEKLKLNVEEAGGLFRPVGCAHCSSTGYHGRIALFETLWIDAEVRDAIARGASEREIIEAAHDYTSLAEDGRRKYIRGLTSLDELRRLAII